MKRDTFLKMVKMIMECGDVTIFGNIIFHDMYLEIGWNEYKISFWSRTKEPIFNHGIILYFRTGEMKQF